MFLENGVLPYTDIVSFLKMKSYRIQILYVSWKWSLTGYRYCRFLENEVLPEMGIIRNGYCMFLGNGVLPEMGIIRNGYCMFLENGVLLKMNIICLLPFTLYIACHIGAPQCAD